MQSVAGKTTISLSKLFGNTGVSLYKLFGNSKLLGFLRSAPFDILMQKLFTKKFLLE